MKRAVAVAAAATAALAATPAGSPSVAGRPVTIDSYGFWSLTRLGYGALVLKENPKTARTQVAIPFRLPPGAKEGPGHWYVIHLHFRAEVRPDSLPGEFNVAADTDGRTCASIIFTVTKQGRQRIVTSDALGLVNGVERIRGSQLVREIRFENFLVIHGIRPGPNVLTFDLTSNAIPMVREVRIFADSGIELARGGPPSVAVTASVREHTVHAGETFHLDVSLTRRSGLAIPLVVLRVHAPAGTIGGTTVRRLRWGSRTRVQTSFRFRALHAGRVPMAVHAETNRFPSDELVLYIDRSRR